MSATLKRDLEKTIKELLQDFPCVVLLGARQVGKSTLLKKVLPNAEFVDLERKDTLEMLSAEPELFLREASLPLIIDEAQFCPELFPALRVKIDEDRKKHGRFLISGSSSPQLLKNISESLAGRVAILEVPTLTWSEAFELRSSKFYDYLDKPEKFINLKELYKLEKLQELALFGLYPEAFLKRKKLSSYDTWVRSYFDTYIERDIRTLFPNLKLDSYRRFIKMLAFSSGELLNASSFARSLDISQPSVKNYMEIAEGTFLWRRLDCYRENAKKRLVQMPKGHLRDNVILNYLLNINTVDDLKSHPQFGRIWEGFIIEQIIKNLDQRLCKHKEFFYRTHNQAEIDLIVQGRFGLIPIEIKSGLSVKREQLIAMKNFIEEHNCPYGILINSAEKVLKLSEKIYQVPVSFI
ncbi:MAG: ATP-binding protein [Vampirovibrionia bacterium]|jgi:predicted AAA+ superfamily ATPase